MATTLESAKLPSQLSAQAALLFALKRACILVKDKSVTIYTDNRYAIGVVNYFGTLWKQCGFLTSSGEIISRSKLVDNLFKAVLYVNVWLILTILILSPRATQWLIWQTKQQLCLLILLCCRWFNIL